MEKSMKIEYFTFNGQRKILENFLFSSFLAQKYSFIPDVKRVHVLLVLL